MCAWLLAKARSRMDDRTWMYTGWKRGGNFTMHWIKNTEAFMNQAFAKGVKTTWCPCSKCVNTRRQTRQDMTEHLCRYGFTTDYTQWTFHGEVNRMRDEVVKRRIEDLDSDAGVPNMLDDFHEANFDQVRREDEPEPSA